MVIDTVDMTKEIPVCNIYLLYLILSFQQIFFAFGAHKSRIVNGISVVRTIGIAR